MLRNLYLSIRIIRILWFIFSFCMLLSSVCLSSFLLYLELIAVRVIFFVRMNSDLRISRTLLYLYSVNVITFLIVLWRIVLVEEIFLIFAFFLKLRFFPFIWWFPFIRDQIKFFCFFFNWVIKKDFSFNIDLYKKFYV